MIERSTDSVNFTPIASVSSGVLTYVDTTVAQSTGYWYQVCAYNAVGDSAFANVISITPGGAPSITSSSSASATVGHAFSYTITASGSPTSFTATPLPAGLSINTGTGAITGTPTATGTTRVTLGAANSSGTGNATLTITVGALPVITSVLNASVTVGTAFNYTITATNSPTGYSASPLPPGLAVNASTGVISGTPTASGTTSVTLGAQNGSGTGSATLTITVAAAGAPPSITSSLSSSGMVGQTYSYSIAASNTPTSYSAAGLPAGFTLNSATGAITGMPTSTGTTTVTIGATNSSGTGTAMLSITVAMPAGSAPSISSALSASATVGQTFSYSITGSNSPTSYNASNLPAGLTVNTSTGAITGTPTAAGTKDVTLSAKNANGTGTATLVLTVTSAGPPPVITSSPSASVAVAAQFSYTITASNSPTSFDAISLPTGLFINTSTGVISGTLAGNGTYSVTVSATNANGTGKATVTITVTGGGPAITSTLSATTTVGQAFSYTITGSNSPTSFTASNLPAGLSVNTSTGAITGMANANGTYYVTIGAENANGTGSAVLALTIAGLGPTVTSSLNASGTVGFAFGYTIAANNGPTSFSSSALPAGLTLNSSTGVITGTPTAAGTFNVTISAGNASGQGSSTLTINIAASAAPPTFSGILMASGSVGRNFYYTISATNGPTSYSASNLPAGLSINTTTGSITGVPTATGVTNVTLGATNAIGSASATLTITVTAAGTGSTSAWLADLSARSQVKGSTNVLIAGFVTTGDAPKTLLLRGIGPSLANFGIDDFLSDPSLSVFDSSGNTLSSSTSWSPSLKPMFQIAGAFGLNSGSSDAAVTETLNPGAYTAEVKSSTSNSGVALAEIYDMNAGDPVNRLSNISARAFVGTGASSLIGGFVIGGSGTESLLIRADGPSLGGFGITNFLANPVLTIFNSKNQVVATITGWGSTATVTNGPAFDAAAGMNLVAAGGEAFESVGAFPLTVGSTDSAIVLTLPAGAYTAQVSGASGGTGVALVEIYELQ